jgi:hypothetical protein
MCRFGTTASYGDRNASLVWLRLRRAVPRTYELPTHRQVEDVLIAGLTARQLVRLMAGASLSYGLWDQAVWLPQELRFSLAVAILVAGLVGARSMLRHALGLLASPRSTAHVATCVRDW